MVLGSPTTCHRASHKHKAEAANCLVKLVVDEGDNKVLMSCKLHVFRLRNFQIRDPSLRRHFCEFRDRKYV